ncbi:hypothetical protein Tco_0076838, partial [Tanacetum coccineum]
GKKISDIDENPNISLIQDEVMTWFQADAEVQEKQKVTTADIALTTADIALNTADIPITTASETPMVSTATERIVYSRRSEEKRKAKGKAIMQESKPPKKIKKKEMMQISLDEEFAKSFYKEEQAQILQDKE